MPAAVDAASPVPLYHQIAEAIRARIVRGELSPGDALEPMRRAAAQWGVHLHTVRHAYVALERDGLVEMRSARGTRVTEKARDLRGKVQAPAETVDAFVARFLREAEECHGLRAAELGALIAARGARRPVVTVIECSAWQCESHAAEIAARWRVDARPWPVTRSAAPEGDVLIATYFHYNDIRRQWPEMLERVRFMTIRVAPAVEAWLGGATRAVLVERDEPTAAAVAADLRAAFPRELELDLVVTADPATALRGRGGAPVLYSPRMWSELDEKLRADARCTVIRYEFDAVELERAARECCWERASSE